MLFGSVVNVILTLNAIQMHSETVKSLEKINMIVNNTKVTEKLIIRNQQDIYKLSENQTKSGFEKLQDMLNNQSNTLMIKIKHLADSYNKTKQ